MNRQPKIGLTLLSVVTIIAGAQSSTGPSTPTAVPQEQASAPHEKAEAYKARWQAQEQERQRLIQETQARGFWIAPSTGLMWAAKDNGKAVTWHTAQSYCRKQRLAGFSDWRLATLDELTTLVDKISPSEPVGNDKTFYINIGRHVKGNLSLTGDPWSSNREMDRFGHPYGPGWFFDFITSKPSYDLQLFRNTKFALCVRRSSE